MAGLRRWHWVTIAAIGGLLVGGVGGCGGSEMATTLSPMASTADTTDPVTPAPTPSGFAKPVLPEAAKHRTAEGAEAFARYWWAVYVYAHLSGDVATLEGVRTAECDFCENVSRDISRVYAKRHRYVGLQVSVAKISVVEKGNTRKYLVGHRIDSTEARIVDDNGAVLNRYPSRENVAVLAGLQWGDIGWEMYGVSFPPKG
jgi:hypothetical protein